MVQAFFIMNITKLAELEKTESMEMEWRGEKIKFEALTTHLTPGFIKKVGTVVSYPAAIVSVVKSWDLFWDEEETQPVELIESELDRLPIPFLDAILSKITESWTGDAGKPQPSQSGLAAKAS